MTEPWLRVLVVGALVVASALVVAGAHRWQRTRARRASLDLSGIEGDVIFFTDSTCGRCDTMRRLLDETGREYVEISYGEAPEVHRRVGVIGVPLIVVRSGGTETGRIAGVVSIRRLRRLLSKPTAG